MKTITYKSQVKRAIDAINSVDANFASYNYTIRYSWIQRLVIMAYKNEEGIEADKFDMTSHVGRFGIKMCPCQPASDAMYEHIGDAIREVANIYLGY